MTEVKRNHHLPRFYLDGWADEKGRIALRRRGWKKAVLTSVENAGVINRFYTPQAELLLGRTETAAAPIIKRLLSDSAVMDDQAGRQVLARFMVELMARQTYMATFLGLSPETTQAVLAARGDLARVLRTLRDEFGPQDTLCFVVSPTVLLKMGGESGKCLWGEKEVHRLNLYMAEHCDHQVIATPSHEGYLSRVRLGKHRPWGFAGSPQPPRAPRRVAS